jgi:8-hydroxy-5-deazaflavin:NADPH oxidoreductase
MKIGIIGAGRIGQMFARRAIAAGHHVIISNSRGPDTLGDLVAELGEHAEAGNVTDAAAADIVMIAVPWWKIEDALRHLPPFDGRIVIDATNAFASYAPLRVAELGGQVSSEIVAGLVPGARVVKAFNTAPAAVFEGDPRVGGGRTVVFLSGDDASAKQAVADIVEAIGFATVDLGDLATGGRIQQLGGPLAGKHLVMH